MQRDKTRHVLVAHINANKGWTRPGSTRPLTPPHRDAILSVLRI